MRDRGARREDSPSEGTRLFYDPKSEYLNEVFMTTRTDAVHKADYRTQASIALSTRSLVFVRYFDYH
ncbi:hypothetical protein BN2476_670057 [Paraburkholderia piptadeniae]|uniref:Uncharacterized protein n=1 Tax=Paraburkholderia piptadeniae TaxID=1701573 RepID=A0A1N7SNG1_9BURK|nr:hypothetical protein BN2476_670057 [Paraburkholderia piptadeniae]